MKLAAIEFVLVTDSEQEVRVYADFAEHGWAQWGAPEAELWETVPLLEAIEDRATQDLANGNEDLARFIGLIGEDDVW